MRTFENFYDTGDPCPICGTVKNSPPVLIPIDGTDEDNICEAMQVHLECLNLRVAKDNKKLVFYQIVEEEE